MGLADAKASNNLLIGIGVGLITTVTGLSAAGTITAINAMHRQSEEALAEEERHQQELDRQQAALDAAQQGGTTGKPGGQGGSDVTYPEDPSAKPSDTPGTTIPEGMMTREQFMEELPDQVRWMVEKHITYDEYGLPRDEYGSLMNDPTTEIYDPARWSYFFGEDNQEKSPKKEDLPTQSEIDAQEPGGGEQGSEGDEGDTRPKTPISERPVVAPDKPSGYEQDIQDPDSIPIENPAVERPSGSEGPGEGGGDGTGEQPGTSDPGGVVAPGVDRPAAPGANWWKGDDGKPIAGISLDENGKPFYVVAPGDSLGSISSKYGFAVSEVVTASKITNPNVLYVGDIIRFPEEGPSSPGVQNPNVDRPGSGSGTGTQPGTDLPSGNEGKTDGVVTGPSSGGSATGLG